MRRTRRGRAVTDHLDRAGQLARIARGWDEAADGYDTYFVPRFAPWVSAAVRAVTGTAAPAGPVLVPCCGTFPELEELLGVFPEREIVGIDLSAGMVARARARAAQYPQVSVVEGDASTLEPEWSGRCAAVVSAFGLQQLPEPDLALRAWAAALRPAGRLSVVFWPSHTEADGPFALLDEVRGARTSAGDRSWEQRLVAALLAEGAVVERDEHPAHPMSHPDAAAFFDAYTLCGPLRPLAAVRGDAFVAELRQKFLRRAPAGEWRHRPRARHLVARRAEPG